jgi:ZIP family zinc transporter
MVINSSQVSWLGVGSVVALAALTAYSLAVDPALKVVGIAWVAFTAMAGAAALGTRASHERPKSLVWGYGLASGAMITSAAVFLVPPAIGHHPEVGGFGVALGVLAGFGAHTAGHYLLHMDLPFEHATLEITAHALAAGSIIGIVYATLPELGLLLGLAIVSHKGPAGYAAARRLARAGKPVSAILLPAAGVGITAIPVTLADPPGDPLVQAGVFGFAAGIFLHVAMDFLPRCELGGEVYEVVEISGRDHAVLDRLRVHAVASTVLGGVAVLAAWLVVA